jgi:hypothetical protein
MSLRMYGRFFWYKGKVMASKRDIAHVSIHAGNDELKTMSVKSKVDETQVGEVALPRITTVHRNYAQEHHEPRPVMPLHHPHALMAHHHDHHHRPSFLTETILNERPQPTPVVHKKSGNHVGTLAAKDNDDDDDDDDASRRLKPHNDEKNERSIREMILPVRPPTDHKKNVRRMMQRAAQQAMAIVRAKQSAQDIQNISIRFSSHAPTDLPRIVKLSDLKKRITRHHLLHAHDHHHHRDKSLGGDDDDNNNNNNKHNYDHKRVSSASRLFRDVFDASKEIDAMTKDMFWYIVSHEFQVRKVASIMYIYIYRYCLDRQYTQISLGKCTSIQTNIVKDGFDVEWSA